jgi:hypothetical protein
VGQRTLELKKQRVVDPLGPISINCILHPSGSKGVEDKSPNEQAGKDQSKESSNLLIGHYATRSRSGG